MLPNALIFKFVSSLQHWMMAWMGPDREDMEKLTESLMARVADDRVEEGVS
jgi:hypothetical protein